MKRVIRVLLLLAAVSLAVAACSSGGDDPEPFGTWLVSSFTTAGGASITNSALTVQKDGTYALSYARNGTAGSHAGTFTPTDLPADTVITYTVVSRGPITTAEPPLGSTWTMYYSNLKSDQATFFLDVDGNGTVGPFTATRQ